MNSFETANAYLRAGLCVLPARMDPKSPTVLWKDFEQRLPTDAELRRWFKRDRPLCILAGAVSGNLEVIDFDCAGECYEPWLESVQRDMPDLPARLLIERSPSGGYHVIYRCPDGVCGNIKLAQRIVVVPDGQDVVIHGKTYKPRLNKERERWEVYPTLIETRGEGGIFLCAPSPGYELVQGDYGAVPVVTAEERELMLVAANALDEVPPRIVEAFAPGDPCGRPGDDFNERGDVRDVLRHHGWSLVRSGENEYWRRPGKDSGWSATLKDKVFFVHSSNAAPFEPSKGYGPFVVYSMLEHAGDFSAAARALRASGYGSDGGDGGVDLSGIIAAPTQGEPELVLCPLSEVERAELAWLWPGRFPLGKLSLLGGDPGLGKSTVTLDLAARVSRGAGWPDNPLLSQPVGTVVLCSAEDDVADTIAPRLDLAGADDTKVIVIQGVQVRDARRGTSVRCFSLEHDLPKLEQAMTRYRDIRLIIIDPISAYCGTIDSHRNNEVRALLAPLADLAARYHVAIVAITHLSKGVGGKAIYRAMGSLAFAAAARAVWAIVKDVNDPQRRLLLPAKLNLAADPDGLAYRIEEGRVVWEMEPIRMHADQAFAAEAALLQGRGKSQARLEAIEWLRNRLAQGPLPSAQVIEEGMQYGMAEKTLRRAFKDLGGESIKVGFDGGWQWSLKGPCEAA
jgi:hypothetical protein